MVRLRQLRCEPPSGPRTRLRFAARGSVGCVLVLATRAPPGLPGPLRTGAGGRRPRHPFRGLAALAASRGRRKEPAPAADFAAKRAEKRAPTLRGGDQGAHCRPWTPASLFSGLVPPHPLRMMRPFFEWFPRTPSRRSHPYPRCCPKVEPIGIMKNCGTTAVAWVAVPRRAASRPPGSPRRLRK